MSRSILRQIGCQLALRMLYAIVHSSGDHPNKSVVLLHKPNSMSSATQRKVDCAFDDIRKNLFLSSLATVAYCSNPSRDVL